MANLGGIYQLLGPGFANWCNWIPSPLNTHGTHSGELNLTFVKRNGSISDQIDVDALIAEVFTYLSIDTAKFTIQSRVDNLSTPPTTVLYFTNLLDPKNQLELIRAVASILLGDDDPMTAITAYQTAADTLTAATKLLPIPDIASTVTPPASTIYRYQFDMAGVMAAYKTGNDLEIADRLFWIVRDAVLQQTGGIGVGIDLIDSIYNAYVTPAYSTASGLFWIDVNLSTSSLKYSRSEIAALIYSICNRGLFGQYELMNEAMSYLHSLI
jgi:hypothetical protein